MFTSREEKPVETSERIKRRNGIDENIIKERRLGKRNHEQDCLKPLIDKKVTITLSYFCRILSMKYMQPCLYTF